VRVLLDENLDHSLRKHLIGHDVVTVSFMGWAGLRNGELLLAAEENGIEVLVTGDRTLNQEQEPRRATFGGCGFVGDPIAYHQTESLKSPGGH
jgi:hypothetical protein